MPERASPDRTTERPAVRAKRVRRRSEDGTIEKIEKLRDRFCLSAAALAAICALAATWVRAPTLEVELPLGGEAKASLNVGYVLALGIPAIAIAYSWILGTLAVMRRYQFEVLHKRQTLPTEELNIVLTRLGATRAKPKYYGALDVAAGWVTTAARVLVLFIIPCGACLWIANAYFTQLEVYPEHNLETCDKVPKGAECRRNVTVAEHVLGFTAAHALLGQPVPHKDDRFAMGNGSFEESCKKVWAAQPGSHAESSEKCVLDEFPRFVLPLTSWSNLLLSLLMVLLAVYGGRAYYTLPTERPRSSPSHVDHEKAPTIAGAEPATTRTPNASPGPSNDT
jgi:hypothetical protein